MTMTVKKNNYKFRKKPLIKICGFFSGENFLFLFNWAVTAIYEGQIAI
jgi:hypothetical protein